VTDLPTAVCCSGPEAEEPGLLALDADGPTLTERFATDVPAPTYAAIAPDGDRCVTVHDHDGGRLRSYALEAEGFRELDRVSTGDEGPAYVALANGAGAALVANYAGGSVAIASIAPDGSFDGEPKVLDHEGSGPDADRQATPHPHSFVPRPAASGDRDALAHAPDLGTDEVWSYEVDPATGRIEPATPARRHVHDGAGPRHLAFHPGGHVGYVANELDSTMTVLAIDPASGGLDVVETVDTLPEAVRESERAENYPADVAVHPSGEWVYCSNRGHDSIAVFSIEEDGQVSPVEVVPTNGEWPRSIALAPDGQHLFVANRHSERVVTFSIDPTDGTLAPTDEVQSVPDPICLAVRPARV